MALKITTLSENTASFGEFLAEGGLSILVESDDAAVLLDAGAGISTVHNSNKLDFDLKKIDRIVLSHGHFDHNGGLRDLLKRRNKEVEIIAHPDMWAPKFSRRKDKPDRYVGIPFQRLELEKFGARFNLTTKPVQITDSITTTGEVPIVTDFEKIASSLRVKSGDRLVADKVLDDLSLIIKTRFGLVVVLGCAHRGVVNHLYHAQHLAGVKKIHMVLGGCHLVDADEERIYRTIGAFRELGVEKVGVSHCTGMPATIALANEFGENFIFNNAGNIINVTE